MIHIVQSFDNAIVSYFKNLVLISLNDFKINNFFLHIVSYFELFLYPMKIELFNLDYNINSLIFSLFERDLICFENNSKCYFDLIIFL
jgi:hypothetical protein